MQTKPQGIHVTAIDSESIYRDSTDSLRRRLSPNDLMTPVTLPKVLLVDDDPTFGKIMTRVAAKSQVEVKYCQSYQEFCQMKEWNYDVAVVDYDLGPVNGFELTAYMEKLTENEIPVILVSQQTQTTANHWPAAIREFIHKSLGPYAVLDAVFEAHEVKRLYREIKHTIKKFH